MRRVEISRPIKDNLVFAVVSYKEMLWDGYEKEINTVILNGADPTEFMSILMKSKEKSIKYHYGLFVNNSPKCISGLKILEKFMIEEGFQYTVTDEMLRIYHQTELQSV